MCAKISEKIHRSHHPQNGERTRKKNTIAERSPEDWPKHKLDATRTIYQKVLKELLHCDFLEMRGKITWLA